MRPHLTSVAYRLTGTVADAEDIVQDAWLRRAAHDGQIVDLRAWFTTVVSRRESYVGQWLPEPVVTGFDGDDPLSLPVPRVRATDRRGESRVTW